MSASFTSGFFVREPAWHGMGVVVCDYPGSWDEARRLAGLEWEPVSAPQFGFTGLTAEGKVTYDPDEAATGDYARDAGRQRIVRSDTGALLGSPSDEYQIISHAEMGEIVEAIEQQPNVKYETTVCLNGGKQVASVVRLDEPVVIPGDNSQTLPYLALTTRHDGSASCRAQSTTVRIVCANTFAAAEAEGDRNGTVFTFSHSRNWRDRIEEARTAIRGLRADFSEYVEFAGHLAGVKVTGIQAEQFVREFIPAPIERLAVSDRVMANIEEARQAVRAILAGPTCETVRGTAFGLVQAAGEYLDHYRGYRSMDTYLGRQLLRPERRKTEAVRLVTSITKG